MKNSYTKKELFLPMDHCFQLRNIIPLSAVSSIIAGEKSQQVHNKNLYKIIHYSLCFLKLNSRKLDCI